MNEKKTTEVVAALIEEGDRFLICRRPERKARGGLYEFVGGKVEPGETNIEALMRECREELAVGIEVGPLYMDVTHAYPDLCVHLSLYRARIVSGTPTLLEHTDARYITPDEIGNYEFCPADRPILDRILRDAKRKGEIMELTEAKAKLAALQQKMAAYDHAMGVISYDGATGAPKGTAENRAITMGILGEESYKLATGEETVSLLEYLDANKDALNVEEKRQVYLMLKSIRQMQKVPIDEYVAYQRLLVQADDVWHTAKETSDFALFEPILTEIFETNIRFAGYFAPEKKPYDFWLGEYEEGLSIEVCDKFFAEVRARLVPLIAKIGRAKQVSADPVKGNFPAEKQRELSLYLMKTIGLDLGHVGISETEHPFTTSLGSHLDERITTHYHEDDLASSMFSVIHEGGHALYDTGSRREYAFTVLDGGVSMGIHESQSRFYENILGRSRAFSSFLFPKLCEIFPSMKAYTADDFYRAINRAEPSLIRTEADEITYCLHVMVRYELEKKVMAGELRVHDLPEAWNRLYREYLGVEVPNDREGVLQDSHWSGGSIGYFPSYALGSAYGAQFLAKMKETVDVEGCLTRGDFGPINAWNKENIWQFGSLYTPKEILSRVLGQPFDPSYYLDYLEEKAKSVYGI